MAKRQPKAWSYVQTMFRDTLAGYMLRLLCIRSEITQAEFMRIFHERSRALGHRKTDGLSSFRNVFGRLVRSGIDYRGAWGPIHYPGLCIRKIDGQRNMLIWDRDPMLVMLVRMRNDELHEAFSFCERNLDKFESDDTLAPWFTAIRQEMAERAQEGI